MYPLDYKYSKIARQVYNYFYPEQEERSSDQLTQFIKKGIFVLNTIVVR